MSYKVKRLEQKKSKPIREILKESFVMWRSQERMAKDLDVQPGTLARWLAENGLEIKVALFDKYTGERVA